LASGHGSTRRNVDPVKNIRGIAPLFGRLGLTVLLGVRSEAIGLICGWIRRERGISRFVLRPSR